MRVHYRLPEGSHLTRRFHQPYLGDALNNQQLRYASYRPPGALQGPDGRYAHVPAYGPRSGHWASQARQGAGPEGDDVWASERVLPHGTIQNLSKWSVKREEGGLDSYSPSPQGPGGRSLQVDWTPERGEIRGTWFDKVTHRLHTHRLHTKKHYTFIHTEK